MRQILATSALSLSRKRPEQREFYHQHAVQLQAEALSGFNVAVSDLNESNIVAAFLVSSLVGVHSFCETFFFRDDNFNTTLDAFIGCIHLLRGIRSIIGGWWPFLMSSELKPVLTAAQSVRDEIQQMPSKLNTLRKLIADADIGPASRQTYEKSIEELDPVFALESAIAGADGEVSANRIFGWLVLVPREYVDLLAQRRPEALILLAYYAVILHSRRKFWAIDDAGQFLMNGISAHLGKHWERWLEEPVSMMQIHGQ